MIRKTVAEILDEHVTFELEAIDRMYMNGYMPTLQTGAGFAYFMKNQLGDPQLTFYALKRHQTALHTDFERRRDRHNRDRALACGGAFAFAGGRILLAHASAGSHDE